jgi:hypothetical protein
MKMHDCDDRGRLLLQEEEDTERESAQQRASDVFGDERKL